MKKVKGSGTSKTFHEAYNGESNTKFLRGVSHPGNQHADSDGTETIENWNCHTDCPVKILDEQSGELKSGAMKKPYKYTNTGTSLGKPAGQTKQIHDANYGTASRFFYCPKASRSERNKGLKPSGLKNTHPTVKPINLIKYLLKLTQMPDNKNSITLDLFSGSGTLPVACEETKRKWVAIEIEEEHCNISAERIKDIIKQKNLF